MKVEFSFFLDTKEPLSVEKLDEMIEELYDAADILEDMRYRFNEKEENIQDK